MLNKVMLIGNLGADADIKALSNNRTVANFSIAVSSSYKDKDGNWVNVTDWVNISKFTPGDYLIANLKKGARVYVEGELKTSMVEKDNVKTYYTRVNASVVKPLDRETVNASAETVAKNDGEPAGVPADDDLPF